MSRDTAGQPVTASGPAKSSASDTGAMPPVPGPDASSTDTSAQPVKAAAPATTGKASTAAGSGSGAAKKGTAPAGAAPTTPEAAASAASRPVVGDPPVASVREPKAARTGQEKASAPSLTPKTTTGPRRVRLAVSRLDPWSVMKLSFLLSIAIGIMIVVASVVFWMVLDGLHVFTEINDMIVAILGEETEVSILQFVELKRVVSLSTMIAIVDVVLLTALSTIAAFLYNVVAALVGGVHLTLTDE